MSDQTIDLSAGAVEYTYPRTVTETSGVDITTDQVLVSLGTWDAPAGWVVPDVLDHPAPSTAVAQLLIGASLKPAPGPYYLWTQVSDAPEVVPRRSPGRITIT